MGKEYPEQKEDSPLLKIVPSDVDGYPNSSSSANTIKSAVNRVPKRFYVAIGAAVLIVSLVSVAFAHELNFQNNKDSTQLKQAAVTYEEELILETPSEIKNEFGPILEFPLGNILPVVKQSRDGRNFFAFYKVPYAKPPIGNLRFELPEKGAAWTGVRQEIEVAPQCIQKVKYSPINESSGEEDCLYMNIYSPNVPEDINKVEELMPTLVYFHGGGSQGNGSRYGPDYFMDENVVLITLQFRVGAFGHLTIPGSKYTGNIGSKDQVLALKWVQEYVRYFGGDPNRVMIFGNSYGAVHTGLHLFSPMSKGLFHRAIMQSGGTLFRREVIDPNPIASVEALALETNCPFSSTNSLVDCLRNMNASELAIIQTPEVIYETVLEVDDGTGNAFMSDYPMNLYRQGKFNKASVIIGVNSAEGNNLFNALETLRSVETTKFANEHWPEYAPTLLNYKTSALDPDQIAYDLKNLYFGNNPIGNETLRNLTDMITDRCITHPAKVEGTFHSSINPVYLYFLTREPKKSYADKALQGFPPGYYGPAHADELQFLFPYYDYPYIPKDSEYYNFSKMLVKLWSDFATSGIPGEDWKPFRPNDNLLEWYMLDEQPQMVDFLIPRMRFWDQFSAKELGYEY